MEKSAALVRMFIGIAVPTMPALSKALRELNAMGNAIKTANEATLHVTLKFLGDTHADLIEPIGRVLEGIAAKFSTHRIALCGIGAFPHSQRPAVIWMGMQHAETLVAMAADIELTMCDFGFEPEERSFSPHLTLGRVKAKPPQSLFELMDAHRETPFGDFSVDEVKLYQSELTPRGPVYNVLNSFPLLRG